jgi:signal transduction histidine kinase
MTPVGQDRLDRRVLVIAPTSKDALTTQRMLESAGIPVDTCHSLDMLVAEMTLGAGVLLVPEEIISVADNRERLAEALDAQPAWSDLPVLVIVRAGAESSVPGEAVRLLGNVTLVERPVRVATLLSAIRTAHRARDRQLQVRDLLAERERSTEALRAADRRKDEFLATLSHELRNPLAPLVTGLHLLRSSGGDASRVRRVAGVMERQLQHLVRLVDDLLEISRITRGLIEIRREPVDLLAAVRHAIDTSRPALDSASHTLVVHLSETSIPVFGDPVRLTQVFSNLLTNAAKYTNQGGTVWVSATTCGDVARVSVRDNGIGISPQQLESVFEMFMQVDRSDRRAQGGLGIGLTLVRSLVALHGGRVEARSAGPGCGSEFIVELPLLPDPIARNGATADPRRLPPQRVLVVDDNRDAADMLAELLRLLGVTVEVANDGAGALDALASFRPDVMLLDIGMPGMDGYAVAREVRVRPGGRAITIIALTGWGQEQDIEHARAAGFDHHLVKPPDLEKLRSILLHTAVA